MDNGIQKTRYNYLAIIYSLYYDIALYKFEKRKNSNINLSLHNSLRHSSP